MPNWYSVAPPHDDIKQGDFDESVFAAKLGDVVSGDAPPDYSDPYAFFQKTYLTKGLEKLLRSVHRKLEAGKGPGVVELQTPFGGGKTHALILAYHYLKNGPGRCVSRPRTRGSGGGSSSQRRRPRGRRRSRGSPRRPLPRCRTSAPCRYAGNRSPGPRGLPAGRSRLCCPTCRGRD